MSPWFLAGLFFLAALHLVGILWYGRINLALLAITICILLIVLTGLPDVGFAAPWLSRYLMFVIFVLVLIGIRSRRMSLFRGCSGAMVIFYVLFLFSSFYSGDVLSSLKWKGLGLLTLLAGISATQAVGGLLQLRRAFALFLVPIAVAVMVLIVGLAGMGARSSLDILGNPNRVGIIGVSLLCFAVYIALSARFSTILRSLAAAFAVALGVAVVATNSRAAMVTAVAACSLMVFPLVARRFKATRAAMGTGLVILAIIAAWFLVRTLQVGQSFSTMQGWWAETGRLEIWGRMIRLQQDSVLGVVFGKGALLDHTQGGQAASWANGHSIYVQILYESGVVGLLVFGWALLIMLKQSMKLLRGAPCPEKWLAYAMIAVPMLVGVAESAPVRGLSLVALVWGMGLGLIDLLVSLQEDEQPERNVEQPGRLRIPFLGRARLPVP